LGLSGGYFGCGGILTTPDTATAHRRLTHAVINLNKERYFSGAILQSP